VRTITQQHIDSLIADAAAADRLRTIFRLHEHEEPVQRMVNAVLPGSYVTPHQHAAPPKVELMAILRGRMAMVEFWPDGEVREAHLLDESGPLKIVDIAPATYHCMVAITPAAVLEIIQGPYHAETHKQFAPWAPAEGSDQAADYLAALTENLRARLGIGRLL
jgi:cupin fold WbuC family metalloprotein